jgi:hypothetical protein
MSVEAALAIDLNREAVEAFCCKWRITELGVPEPNSSLR